MRFFDLFVKLEIYHQLNDYMKYLDTNLIHTIMFYEEAFVNACNSSNLKFVQWLYGLAFSCC
jgi:hypothetical protein